MNSSTNEPIEQLRRLLAEVESLAVNVGKAAAETAGEGQAEAVERLRSALNAARARIREAEQALQHNVVQGAKAADSFVRDNTWMSIGVAAAVAFLLGALTARRE